MLEEGLLVASVARFCRPAGAVTRRNRAAPGKY